MLFFYRTLLTFPLLNRLLSCLLACHTGLLTLSPSIIQTLGSSIVVSSLEFFFSCPSFGLHENLYVVAVYIIFHGTSPARFILFFFSFFFKINKPPSNLKHVTIRALRPMRLPNHIKRYISLLLCSFCFSLIHTFFIFYFFFYYDARVHISDVSRRHCI